MAECEQIGEVRTSYDVHGEGEPLVLLHPGGADSRTWAPNLPALAERFRVFTPDRRGHGRTPDVDGPITYELMARDTLAFLETVVGGPASLVGHSDGAVVGLVAALLRPDLVSRVVVSAVPFHHEGWIPGAIELPDDVAAWMGDSYGEVSPDGRAHWDVVSAKLDRMHREEPALTPSDLARVTSPALVLQGDDDEVKLEHAVAMYRGLADGRLAVVPGADHGLLVRKPELCNAILLDFLGA